jgi:predicted heme/steroid binding protein
MREFTRKELADCDGKDGARALIALNGRVYDVSDSYHWRSGKHHALHRAGADLTDALEQAPHGVDLLERVPMVGTLQED